MRASHIGDSEGLFSVDSVTVNCRLHLHFSQFA